MTEPDPAEIPHDSIPAPAPEVIDHVGETSPPHPPITRAAPRRGGTPLLLTLVLFAGLGGGLYWVWLHPNAGTTAPASDQQAAIDSAKSQLAAQLQEAEQGLGQQIQALSVRVTALEKQAQEKPAAAPGDTTPPPAPDVVASLAKRLDDLAATVAALSARQEAAAPEPQKAPEAAPPPPGPDVAALAAQQQEADSKIDQGLAQQKAALDTLDQRLAKLEQAAGQDQQAAQAQSQEKSQDAAALAALNARLGKLEQGEGQDLAKDSGAAKDATLAIKLEAAQAALLAGQPLGALPNAPPALSRFATTPPPTEAGLRAAFPQVAAAALAASRPDTAQQSFFQRALARIQQTVTVRRGDHVIVGDPAAGVLARAQDDVGNGDLKGATEALASLHGPAKAAVQDWVAQVNALLEARAALAALAAHG